MGPDLLVLRLDREGLFVYDPSRAPGDYENGGVLGVPNGSTLPAGDFKSRKLKAEIANGRLAMMAITGMFYPAACGKPRPCASAAAQQEGC